MLEMLPSLLTDMEDFVSYAASSSLTSCVFSPHAVSPSTQVHIISIIVFPILITISTLILVLRYIINNLIYIFKYFKTFKIFVHHSFAHLPAIKSQFLQYFCRYMK